MRNGMMSKRRPMSSKRCCTSWLFLILIGVLIEPASAEMLGLRVAGPPGSNVEVEFRFNPGDGPPHTFPPFVLPTTPGPHGEIVVHAPADMYTMAWVRLTRPSGQKTDMVIAAFDSIDGSLIPFSTLLAGSPEGGEHQSDRQTYGPTGKIITPPLPLPSTFMPALT
jgi:hypothetical protein